MASQHAELKLRFGRRTRISAAVDVTPEGLLAIGGLIGMILVSTATIVRAARTRPIGAEDRRRLAPPR